MCVILLQIYACGHDKEITTTPCPPAIASAYLDWDPYIETSTTTWFPPSPVSTQHQRSTSTTAGTRPVQRQQPLVNGFRHSTPSRGRGRPPIDAPLSVYTSLHSHPPTRPSSPGSTTLSSRSATPNPHYCSTFFRRYLPPSRYPCLACYMRPEWTWQRNRWINDYRIMHPGTRIADLPELAGVSQIPERVGLINIVAEMERMESVNRERPRRGAQRERDRRDQEP
ncbi:hypothetical protein BDV95DRAFT_352422 [Massariosphaeria phaeospora]|uniref:Uncharacterized protein n=1 Tax=Massariosphaeria phaeospora TaxID=100035 RepID=A0A7C8MB47_9PLEO|nr:hypothetical protein BDV95DRAFT_352422 [Massariosphaeria phaeospora]